MNNQQRAMAAVAKAKKEGILLPLDGSIQCMDCDKPAAHYDHRDYLRPLDVDPVCVRCNFRRGSAKNNDKGNSTFRTISISMAGSLKDKLKIAATNDSRTVSNFVMKILSDWLDKEAAKS